MSIEVILKEHVEHLGRRGEIVKVADGYARNFLFPRKLALAVVGSALLVGVVDFLVVLALLPVAVRVVDLLALRLGAGAAAGATWWLVCVSAIGVASVVRAFRTRALVRFLVLGAVAMTALGWLR